MSNAHFAILKMILAINSAIEDDAPLKILSLLSFQVDYKIENIINLQRMHRPVKCTLIQDLIVPANDCAEHYAMPHVAMK